jgi:hypothetical protein
MGIEQFVAKPGVEALDEAVLPGTAPRNSPLGGSVQAPGRSGAPTVSTRFEHGRCRRGDARGLEVSPCSLGEDHLVQSQIRDCAPKTGVLRSRSFIRLTRSLLSPPYS